MSSYVKIVQDSLAAGDIATISILVAIFVVIFTILLLAFRGTSNKRQGVLLVGLCDSGKTLLYSRLVDNRFSNTHTSVKENSGTYQLSNKSTTLRVIDLPGHERLRTKFFEQYKSLARGIVFVVDSATVTKDIREVGEYLYRLMTDGVISKNHPPMLIACNKQDQTLAKGARIIQASLEKELDTVRKTQAAALEGTTTTGSNSTYLGRRNKRFEFTDLKPLKVDFAECSIRGTKDDGTEPDMDDITQWLEKIA